MSDQTSIVLSFFLCSLTDCSSVHRQTAARCSNHLSLSLAQVVQCYQYATKSTNQRTRGALSLVASAPIRLQHPGSMSDNQQSVMIPGIFSLSGFILLLLSEFLVFSFSVFTGFIVSGCFLGVWSCFSDFPFVCFSMCVMSCCVYFNLSGFCHGSVFSWFRHLSLSLVPEFS